MSPGKYITQASNLKLNRSKPPSYLETNLGNKCVLMIYKTEKDWIEYRQIGGISLIVDFNT